MASALLLLGTIVDATSVRHDLDHAITKKKPVYPVAFREYVSFALDDPANQKVLVLPAGTIVSGDLILDWSKELEAKRIAAIVTFGDLKVEGAIVNPNPDGGPFLFVAGDLEAKRIDKGGSLVAILGDVRLKGPALCEYNHGCLMIGGDLWAEFLLNLDHDVTVSGETHGVSLSGRYDDLREALVEEVFSDDDPENVWPDGDLIRKRIAAGQPLLREKR